jgi:hypothetical protein
MALEKTIHAMMVPLCTAPMALHLPSRLLDRTIRVKKRSITIDVKAYLRFDENILNFLTLPLCRRLGSILSFCLGLSLAL